MDFQYNSLYTFAVVGQSGVIEGPSLAEVISEKYKEGRYRDKALKFVEYFGGMETCVLSNLVAKNPNYDPFRLAVEYNKAQKLMSASNKPLSSSLQNTVVTDPDISLKLSGLECADSGKSPNPLSSEAVLQGRATLPTSGDEKVPLDEMKTSEVHGIREQLHSSKLIDLNTRKQEVFVPFAEGWFTYSPGVLQDRDAIENAREILNKAKLLPWGISIAMMKLGLFTNGCRVCCLENFSSLHESFYHFLSENHLRKVSENKNGRCRFTKFDTELAEKVLKEAQKVSSCREVADVQAEVKSSKEPLKVPRNRNRRSASAFFRTFFELLGGVPLMIGEPRLPSTSLKGDEAFYLHNNLFEAFGKIDKNHLETFLSEIGDLKMTCSLCDTDGSEGLETDELITHLISSLHRRNLLRDSSISLNDAEIWLIILRELAEPIECSIKCKVSMEASLAHSASKHVDPSGGITASSAETNCSMDEQSLKDNFQLKVKEDPEKGKERSPVLEKLPTPEACGTTSKTPEKPKNPTGEPQPSKNLKTGIKIAQDINLALFVAQTRDVDEKTRKLSDEERQIALDFLRETYKKHGMERTSKAKLNGKFLCSWCNYLITDFAEFYQHILYNEKHLSNIRAVFLEDISYHLQFLRRQLYSPLLQESESNVKTLSKAQIADNFQKLCRKLKVHSTDLPPSRNSFFLHFVKKCAICNVSLLGRPSVLEHLCNDTHYKKLLEARVTAKDFAFWNSMFS